MGIENIRDKVRPLFNVQKDSWNIAQKNKRLWGIFSAIQSNILDWVWEERKINKNTQSLLSGSWVRRNQDILTSYWNRSTSKAI